MLDKPLLMLDVDGVISLYGFDPAAPPAGRFALIEGQPHYLSAAAGQQLSALAQSFELVWATGWEEKASEYLPGLLKLPFAPPHLVLGARRGSPHRHWKLAAIEARAGPARPLAWVDDDHDQECLAWARARAAPTLLLATKPPTGLTDADVDELLRWAQRRLGPRR